MMVWPLDNADYTAEAIGAFASTRTRGVFSAEDCFRVTSTGGFKIKLSPGLAWLKNDKYWGLAVLEKVDTYFELEVGSGLLPRYVAVCILLDKTANTARKEVRYGEYSDRPQKPQPRRDAYYDEIIVATILQRAAAVEITPADITDERTNEALCGLMRDSVTGIPLDGLLEQMQADFAAWYARMRGQLDEDAAGHLQLELDAVSDRLNPELLWVNAMPESAFPRGNIEFSCAISDFQLLQIDFLGTAKADAQGMLNTVFMRPDQRVLLTYDTMLIQSRLIASDGERLKVGPCQVTLIDRPGEQFETNLNLIPYRIYGIKK